MVYEESLVYHPDVKDTKESSQVPKPRTKETKDFAFGSKYKFYQQ